MIGHATAPRQLEPREHAAPGPLASARVLYISYDGLLEPLGQSQIVPYVRGLAARGATIHMLSFEKSLEDAGAQRRQLQADGVQWTALRYHKSPSVPATLYDVLHGVLAGWRLIRRERITLVHARSEVAGIMAWMLKRLTGARFLFDMRGFWPEERVEGGLWRAGGWLHRAASAWESQLVHEADAVITLTRAARQVLERHPHFIARPRRIVTIPTCVDLDRFRPQLKSPERVRELGLEGRFVLAYSGALGTWYLLEEMARFFRAVARRIEPAHFLILTGSPEASVRRALAAHEVPQDAVTVRAVPFAEMPEWVSLADAAVLFRRPAASLTGVCPTKLGEFLACGVPVALNAGIGDCDELIHAHRVGVVVPELTPSAYDAAAASLVALCADSGLPGRCREAADVFRLDEGVARYGALYEELARS